MKLSRQEQETIVTKAADEGGWTIYTSIPKHARRLSKIAIRWGVSKVSPHPGAISVTLPEKAVRFLGPSKRRGSAGGPKGKP